MVVLPISADAGERFIYQQKVLVTSNMVILTGFSIAILLGSERRTLLGQGIYSPLSRCKDSGEVIYLTA